MAQKKGKWTDAELKALAKEETDFMKETGHINISKDVHSGDLKDYNMTEAEYIKFVNYMTSMVI